MTDLAGSVVGLGVTTAGVTAAMPSGLVVARVLVRVLVRGLLVRILVLPLEVIGELVGSVTYESKRKGEIRKENNKYEGFEKLTVVVTSVVEMIPE